MTGGVVQGIRLCFNNHAPEQAGVVLAFFPAGNQKGLGRPVRQGGRRRLWGVFGGRGGCGSGLKQP